MSENTAIELFAGVGGFRIGMNSVKLIDGKTKEKDNWKIVFSNQWEPGESGQYAYQCYVNRFGANHQLNMYENTNIEDVPSEVIPKHKLLVGGFPCQDYSVARSLKGEGGIKGKKGVLWWQINRIISDKKPKFVLLENVDRLLKSPSKQRGRDFAIMLKCLYENGYGVEWRVINAADYGMPQKRRRVFIFAFSTSTKYYKDIGKYTLNSIIDEVGLFQKCFSARFSNLIKEVHEYDISSKEILEISDEFTARFENAGVMIDGMILTKKVLVKKSKCSNSTLRDILDKNVDEKYYLTDEQISKISNLRSGKKIPRVKPNGEKYFYSEGAMSDVDDIDKPGRTMLTSEKSINRSTHIIRDPQTSRVRFITPNEAEKMNMFPPGWTEGFMPESKRYFMMGNALVTGVVKKLTNRIKRFN